MSKYCPGCNTTKPSTEFAKNARRLDGLAGWCKACTKVKVVEWKMKNPLKVKQHSKNWAQKKRKKIPVP